MKSYHFLDFCNTPNNLFNLFSPSAPSMSKAVYWNVLAKPKNIVQTNPFVATRIQHIKALLRHPS